jgi:hypothetical protein
MATRALFSHKIIPPYGTSGGGVPLTIETIPGYYLDYNAEVAAGSGELEFLTDESGNGNHTDAQATPTSRATLTANQVNSKPAFIFASGDSYTMPSAIMGSLMSAGAMTVFFVTTRDTGITNRFLEARDAFNITTFSMGLSNSGANYSMLGKDGGSYSTVTGLSLGSGPHIFTYQKSGTSLTGYIDGVEMPQVESEDQGLVTMYLGRQSGSNADHLRGKMCRMVVYNRALTATERNAVHAQLSEQWGTPTPATETTYDAQFIWLGASHTFAAWNSTPLIQGEFQSNLGAKVLTSYHNGSGWVTSTLKNNIDAILAKYPNSTPDDGYVTYVPFEIGGNNVSSNQIYSAATQALKDGMTADITYINNAIKAKGFVPILHDLTFRDYSDNTYEQQETKGSKAYNINIIRPIVEPEWKYPSGVPWGQNYDITVRNYVAWLDPDNVHLNPTGYAGLRQFFYDGIGNFIINGVPPTQIDGMMAAQIDASDTSSITESSGLVSIVACQAGQNNLTQATGGNQPSTGTRTQNSLNVLDFATDKFMTFGAGPLRSTSLFADANDEWTVMATFIADGDGTIVAKAGATGGNRQFQLFAGGGFLNCYVRGTQTSLGSITAGNVYTVIARWDKTTLSFLVNGTPIAGTVGTASAEASEEILVGARTSASPGYFLDGAILDVQIFDRCIYSDEADDLDALMATKWDR